jgi:hypothetical protein
MTGVLSQALRDDRRALHHHRLCNWGWLRSPRDGARGYKVPLLHLKQGVSRSIGHPAKPSLETWVLESRKPF